VLVVNGQEPNATYSIRADLRHVLAQLLAIMESTAIAAPQPEGMPAPTPANPVG